MEKVGVGLRALAVIIDSLILMVVGWAIAKMTGQTATADGFNMTGAPALLLFLIGLGYYVVMEATSGGTVGKKAMGIRVVSAAGGPISWQASIIRNLLRIVDGFFFYLVGAIIVWVSKDKQRLGDIAAKTLVVKGRGAAANDAG
jgi:uncharacterized RDD family membrane protein YckC